MLADMATLGSQNLEDIKEYLQANHMICTDRSVSECQMQVLRGPRDQCSADEQPFIRPAHLP